MSHRRHHTLRGFTLLEVLIALAIFAIIGVASYRVLSTVILSQQSLQRHSEQLRDIQRAMLYLSLDLSQIIDRPVRGAYGEEQAALTTVADYPLELTRSGWRNPLRKPRSHLQRVAYELGTPAAESAVGGKLGLLRHYWRVLDRAQDSEPGTQLLLSGVQELRLRFLDAAGEWHSQWPQREAPDAEAGLPAAIEVQLLVAGYGEIVRVFSLGKIAEVTP